MIPELFFWISSSSDVLILFFLPSKFQIFLSYHFVCHWFWLNLFPSPSQSLTLFVVASPPFWLSFVSCFCLFHFIFVYTIRIRSLYYYSLSPSPFTITMTNAISVKYCFSSHWKSLIHTYAWIVYKHTNKHNFFHHLLIVSSLLFTVCFSCFR